MPTLNLEVTDETTLEQVLKDLAWAARERARLRAKDARSREARKAARLAKATPAPAPPVTPA